MEYIDNDIKDLIRKIQLISESILEHYEKLSKLEVSGKKDSMEFNKIIEELKSSLALENSLYGNLPKDPTLLALINQNYLGNKKSYSEVDVIKSKSNKELINARIDNKIFHITNDLRNVRDASKSVEIPTNGKIEQVKLPTLNKLSTVIKYDQTNAFLMVLNSCIERDEYKSIKDKLIRFKYLISFAYQYIETDFLKNGFNVPDNLFLEREMISTLYKVPSELVELFQNSNVSNIISEDIYSDLSDIINVAIIEMINRVALIMASPSLKEKMINELEKMMSILSLTTNYDGKIYRDILENHEEDKKRISAVTFRF